MTTDIYLTDREADVMQVLWDHGPSVVNEVKDKLHDELAYTTVLTILRTLEQKGYVKHEEEGRVHRYAAAVKENAARKSALHHLTGKLFKGSSELLFTHLVSDQKLSKEQIQRMRDLLAENAKKDDSRRRNNHVGLDALRGHGVVLLSVGAFLAERAARLKRAGTRWIWITAIIASLVLPTLISSVAFRTAGSVRRTSGQQVRGVAPGDIAAPVAGDVDHRQRRTGGLALRQRTHQATLDRRFRRDVARTDRQAACTCSCASGNGDTKPFRAHPCLSRTMSAPPWSA